MAEICSSCGSPVSEKFNFCPQCGSGLNRIPAGSREGKENNPASSEQQVLVCSTCGDHNEYNSPVCRGCGAVLSKTQVKTVKVTTPSTPAARKPNSLAREPVTKQKKSAAKKPETNTVYLWWAVSMTAAAIVLFILYISRPGSASESLTNGTAGSAMENTSTGKVDLGAMNNINALEERVKANPEDLKTLLELGHTLNDAGFFDRAIDVYARYLKTKPAEAEVIIDMGVCFFNQKKMETADSLMKAALKIIPDHPIGLYNLGIISMSKGDLSGSKKWFEKLIETHPESEQAKQAQNLLKSHSLN